MNKQTVSTLLNELLATLAVFKQNAQGFHWNVKGKYFFELHEQFGNLYRQLDQLTDEVAERLLALGGKPIHTFSEFLKHSKVAPAHDVQKDKQAVELTVQGLKTIATLTTNFSTLFSESHDNATSDLMNRITFEVEKQIWMWQSWLED
ncbi:MAG: DNA starvation/stationary phase protection protein [Cytophagales bacterium]|nr:DNA starvation/stationary phase protection protein [Cytophagales bacterium]MDW8385267.1 DNA starvation/stationary phase protection protein [Flammeovirgaceae bacterium]